MPRSTNKVINMAFLSSFSYFKTNRYNTEKNGRTQLLEESSPCVYQMEMIVTNKEVESVRPCPNSILFERSDILLRRSELNRPCLLLSFSCKHFRYVP